MNVLIIDTETTGLDPQKDFLLEIAAILWSATSKCVLVQVSTLIKYPQTVQNPAEPINFIPSPALQEVPDHQPALSLIERMASSTNYICAHNASFDKAFCKHLTSLQKISSRNWVDTQDITYPQSHLTSSYSLNNLAILHRIPIVDSHRALNDCNTLVKLLTLVPDLEEQLRKASRPKVLVKSLEDKPGTLSKKSGFKWHSIIPFSWAKYMPEEDISLLPFSAIKVSFEEAKDLQSTGNSMSD